MKNKDNSSSGLSVAFYDYIDDGWFDLEYSTTVDTVESLDIRISELKDELQALEEQRLKLKEAKK